MGQVTIYLDDKSVARLKASAKVECIPVRGVYAVVDFRLGQGKIRRKSTVYME